MAQFSAAKVFGTPNTARMLKYPPPFFTKQLLLLIVLFCLLVLTIFLWYDIELMKIDLKKPLGGKRPYTTTYQSPLYE